MAKRKTKPTADDLADAVAKYESMWEEISGFLEFVSKQREDLREAEVKVAETKSAYEEAKAEAATLRDSIAGAKDALFRVLEPGAAEFMPLFDRMEPTDKQKHGEHADEWRRDPIAALRCSPAATARLIDADIVLVGQLQDRVLADPHGWWAELDGMTASVAAAIADKLNDFIFKDGGRD